MIALSFIQEIFADIMLGLLDTVVYNLISLVYHIFLQVSRINLFGGSISTALDLYDGFTSRVYTILSIVMIFVLAYQIILLIINPDGKTDQSTGLIKNIIISLIAIALCPTIFGYMAIFQEHVIADGTITAMVLGTSGASGKKPGKTLSMITLQSMYHPVGSGFATFIGQDGKIRENMATLDGEQVPEAVHDCVINGANKELCDLWFVSMKKWADPTQYSTVAIISSNSKFIEKIGDEDGMEYLWIVSTGCGCLVVWFIISYTIDLGTRAVKLGFLQLVAPIALIMRVIPSMDKNFEKWKNQLIKTYLDIFLKLFVISFIIQICLLIPDFIEILFNATDAVEGFFAKGIAIVALILGLLAFAKEAPALLKDIFGGSQMFEGLNFKPGVKDRLESNEYAKKFGGVITQGLGGGIGNAARRVNKRLNNPNRHEMIQNEDGSWSENPNWIGSKNGFGRFMDKLGTLGTGVIGFMGGAQSGAANGLRNGQDGEVSVTGVMDQFKQGAEYGSQQGRIHQDAFDETDRKISEKFGGGEDSSALRHGAGAVAGKVGSFFANSRPGTAIRNWGTDVSNSGADVADSWINNVLTGQTTTTASPEMMQQLSRMESLLAAIAEGPGKSGSMEANEKAYKKALQDAMSGKTVQYQGQSYSNDPRVIAADPENIKDLSEMKKAYKQTQDGFKQQEYAEKQAYVRQQQDLLRDLQKILKENFTGLSDDMKEAMTKAVKSTGKNNPIDGVTKCIEDLQRAIATNDAERIGQQATTNANVMDALNKIIKTQMDIKKQNDSLKPAEGGSSSGSKKE